MARVCVLPDANRADSWNASDGLTGSPYSRLPRGGPKIRKKRYSYMNKPLFTLAIAVAMSSFIPGQERAPRDTAQVELQGGTVVVEYGRPSLSGRKFEDLIKDLPADRMWRAGADQITTLTTEVPLMIGGAKVPVGQYTLYVHCAESGAYSLALNSVLGQPLGKIWSAAPAAMADEPWPHFSYQKEIGDKEILRVPLLREEIDAPVDRLSISMSGSAEGAKLRLLWGQQSWSVSVQAATP